MIDIIRDFLQYRRTIKNYQKIDLTKSQKIKLEAFDKDTLSYILDKTYENLARELLKEDITKEYARGYKHWANHISTYFRKHN
jgi:hypothetical protein